MTWVFSRLCSDLTSSQPVDKLRVYTFGSAAPKMTLPLGYCTGQQRHKPGCEGCSYLSFVSRYAFEDDPFAKIGFLMGALQRMAGRLIGEVYALQGPRRSGCI